MCEENSLKHHGIKGMKWGKRRFQNADGSLTEAGKRRYDSDTRDMSELKKSKYKPNVDKWVQDDLETGRRLSNEAGNLTRQLKDANDKAIRNPKKVKMDLSNMSDQEMRNQISRALLEKQYNDMFAPQKTSKGRAVVGKILESAGTVLAIGSSALGIALSIKQLRS